MAKGKENIIQIVSQYTDLSSEKIKASFHKTDKVVDNTANEIKKMRTSISRSMTASRKDMKQAMDGMANSMTKQRIAVRKTSQETGRYRQSLGSLGKEVGKIRNYFLLFFFVLRPIQRAFTGLLESMTKQEDAIKRLDIALKSQATYTPRVSKGLIDMSKAFQKVTKYGDEAVQEVMQQLITIGGVMPYQLKRVTQATLDFSAATGRDLRTSSLIMAKAASGFTGELSRYGIVIDQSVPKTEKFAKVLEFIETRMGGNAQQDVQTISGRYKQLGNAFGDVKENIGFVVIEAIKLETVFSELNKFATTGILGRLFGRGEATTGVIQLRKELEKTTKTLNLLETTGRGEKGKRYTEREVEVLKDQRIILVRLLKTEAEREKLRDRSLRLNDKIAQKEQKRAKILREFKVEYETWEMKMPERELASLDKRYQQYKKLVKDKIKLEQWYADERKVILRKIEAAENEDKRLENFRESMGSLKVYLSKEGKAYESTVASFATGMRDAFQKGFISVIKGDLRGLEDIVVSFGDMMLQTIMKVAATSLMVSAGFGKYLGVGVHSGGYIKGDKTSHGFGSRKKYHSGGEVNATLLEGEGVLNKRAMNNLGVDNLNKLNSGGGVGGGQTINNYYIQTIDERSFRERLSQHPDIYTNASETNIRDNGSLRGTSQKWG